MRSSRILIPIVYIVCKVAYKSLICEKNVDPLWFGSLVFIEYLWEAVGIFSRKGIYLFPRHTNRFVTIVHLIMYIHLYR